MGRFIATLSKVFKRKPKSFASAQSLESFTFQSQDFQTEKGKKLLYTIFRRYPLIFRGINLRAVFAIPSIKFNFNGDNEKRVVDKFLKELHPNSGLKCLADWLRDLHMDTDIFGSSFPELIWNKESTNLIGLKKIHPISIDFQRKHGEKSEIKLDELGNPVGFIQVVGSQKTDLDYKDVLILTFNTIGDEILGTSILEPLYKTVWRLMNIEEGAATAIFRHGFPLYDITVAGSLDGKPPKKAQLDEAATEVKGLNYKSEFIHPPNYKVKLLEAFSLGKVDDYTSPFIDSIASGLGIPRFLLLGSAKDISRTTAGSLLKGIGPSIFRSREKIKLFFEKEILQPLMQANHIQTVPEIEFGKWWMLEEEFVKEVIKEVYKARGKTINEDESNKDFFQESGASTTESPQEGFRSTSAISKKKKKKISDCISEVSHLEELNFDLENLKALPGLYIVPEHANLIYEGDKRQIVKSPKSEKTLRPFIGKPMYLVGGKKVYGIIKLRKPRKIDVNDFIHLRYAHKISDEERKEWWPKEKNLYVYEFDSQFFPKLKSFNTQQGVQVLIKKVEPK